VNHFHRRGGQLWAEDVPLARIAARVGTPTYVYSTATLERHLAAVQSAFAARPTHVCYSVKACSSLAILRLLARHGAGFDIVSVGELQRVVESGGDPRGVVFSGVGKREDELVAALRARILMFNVESEEELLVLNRIGRRLRLKAPFALRVNPHVDAKTHRYIATGLKTSKFGVGVEEAIALYRRAKKLDGLVAKGIDCHIGSQLTDARPVRQAVAAVCEIFRMLRGESIPLTHIDVGGGLGVTYTDEEPPSLTEYASAVSRGLGDLDAKLVLEPGRVLVANAGVLLTRVIYRKKTDDRRFIIVDAGMNDLVRPALYEATHDIRPVGHARGRKVKADVVGPVCESSDVLGAERMLPQLQPGDLLAVMTAGAYGMSMASTYNSRPRPAEVLVSGGRFRTIRSRETLKDLWRGETT
jgi:diaminopimelate decarboxylase